ncbi:phosphatase PAP2 family protein [Aliarcobacter cibarius]|uniref:Phosphatase PAP2 family protein n=1 Tax=Aliarcobacter cibarius TaxID=255507 RepID=A0A7L5JNV5_9BACT|nr:phosphatase PAP2 family protein [Aliarcobacter cibarius]QKJ26871.1 phosphatase, PAP2 family [Aliarcobacter cibarius]TLS96013.1 phosphatase PAP2 family protein [Aliarcobacter cibarius]TLS96630.1 phosphatase PAP2 family protein [Aliarcobacter cibarius]TLT03079.1 phosphatase PAP2 family protein [Aliarcobacter cibarius]
MDQIILSWIQEYSTFIIKYIGYFFVIIWFIFWLIMFYWGCEITKFCKNIYRKYRLFFRKLLIPFPKTRDFLIQRFDNSKLSGLNLTLASIIFVSLFFLLSGVTEEFIEQDFIIQIDYWVAKNVALIRTESIVNFFHYITLFGNGETVFSLLTIISLIMIFKYNYFWSMPLIISVFGAISNVWLSKYFFLRSRPVEAIFFEHTPSFPSGHAAVSIAFYALLFYIWWRRQTSCNIRIIITFLGSTFALLLASSRIIIGVHYITDVMAGLLLGALWFVIAVSLYEWLNYKKYIKLK